MALEEKGMALGKSGMALRHAKRGWGKHYECNFSGVWKQKNFLLVQGQVKSQFSLVGQKVTCPKQQI